MADGAREISKKQTETGSQVERTRATRIYAPDVDIIERADDIILFADVPGIDETSLDVSLEKDLLTIYGRVEVDIPRDAELLHAGFGMGDFQRAFTLSDEIDRDKIEATVKNGVLRLVLPKAQVQKTRRITVKAGT